MDGDQKKLWIDCDAGVDDAQAIFLALEEPGWQVVGISCVHGNAPVQQVAANVLRVLTLCCRTDIPVYVGCGSPLVAPPQEGNLWFGRDGLGDAQHVRPTMREVEVRPSPEHGAVRLMECAKEHEGQLTVVALGPLTNVALACKLDPSFPSRLSQLVVMGAAEAVGNITPTAEFNSHMDPEAAYVVLDQYATAVSSGRPCSLQLVTWECAERHALPWQLVEGWLAKQTPRARFLAGISEHSIAAARSSSAASRGWECADPLAMAAALRPHLIAESKKVFVQVELAQGIPRAMSVVDWNATLKKKPNATLVTSLSRPELLSMLERSLEA